MGGILLNLQIDPSHSGWIAAIVDFRYYTLHNIYFHSYPLGGASIGKSMSFLISQVKFIKQQRAWRPLTCCILGKSVYNILAFKNFKNFKTPIVLQAVKIIWHKVAYTIMWNSLYRNGVGRYLEPFYKMYWD